MSKFQAPEQTITDLADVKTYDEIIADLRQNLVKIHEYSCASGDMYASLGRMTEGEVSQVIGKTGEINYEIIVILERMVSTLNTVDKYADLVLHQTLRTRTRVWSWKKAATWMAIGMVSIIVTMGAGWAVGVRTGSLVGYSRAFEDLAAGGMIEMKRHGDWVDLTMGPSNPVGRDRPNKPKPTLRLDADKVPELR